MIDFDLTNDAQARLNHLDRMHEWLSSKSNRIVTNVLLEGVNKTEIHMQRSLGLDEYERLFANILDFETAQFCDALCSSTSRHHM